MSLKLSHITEINIFQLKNRPTKHEYKFYFHKNIDLSITIYMIIFSQLEVHSKIYDDILTEV